MYRTMVDGPMAAGRWSTVDAECVALRGCSTAPWMYRAMVGGAMVADRCSAAWRCALSEFEEKTRDRCEFLLKFEAWAHGR